jgi:hypothetical protein
MGHKLKAWLKRNLLTEDESDYIAVIESFGSIAPKGIIEELRAEGMELKIETVLNVITRYNRKCIEMVLKGCSHMPYIHNSLCQTSNNGRARRIWDKLRLRVLDIA